MANYTTYNYKRQYNGVYSPTKYSDKTGAYASDISRAQAQLNQLRKPSAYTSQYGTQLNDVLKQYQDRKFSYDPNTDAMYQIYRDYYMAQGKQAMRDATAQAAAMTGGYGNSYAATVGNQQYQQYLGQLDNVLPELYQQAYARYSQEGQDMLNHYNMLAQADATDYSRYRDAVADYQTDRGYYDTLLQNLRSQNQNLWAQDEQNRYNAYNMDLNEYWNAIKQTEDNYRQAVAEDQFNANLAEQQRQFNESQAYNYARLNEDARQYNENLTYQREQAEREVEQAGTYQKLAEAQSQRRILDARNSIKSEKEFYNTRRLSNNYKSYKDYVEQMIDKNKELTDAERRQLMSIYGL